MVLNFDNLLERHKIEEGGHNLLERDFKSILTSYISIDIKS